jgi:hypothetical protein
MRRADWIGTILAQGVINAISRGASNKVTSLIKEQEKSC